jgi:hypothetical protein
MPWLIYFGIAVSLSAMTFGFSLCLQQHNWLGMGGYALAVLWCIWAACLTRCWFRAQRDLLDARADYRFMKRWHD